MKAKGGAEYLPDILRSYRFRVCGPIFFVLVLCVVVHFSTVQFTCPGASSHRVASDDTTVELRNVRSKVTELKDELRKVQAQLKQCQGGFHVKAPPKGREHAQDPTLPHISCDMSHCYDYLRCSVQSGMTVYFYSPPYGHVVDSIRLSVSSLLRNHDTAWEGKNACLYLALVGESTKAQEKELQNYLRSLKYWRDRGQNHVLINLARTESAAAVSENLDTGQAIVVQSSFSSLRFRPGFDIVAPPSLGDAHGDVWQNMAPFLPLQRPLLLSFVGEYKAPSSSDANDSRADKGDFTAVILETLRNLKAERGTKMVLKCSELSAGLASDWLLCGNRSSRLDLLKRSVFALIIAPSLIDIISTTLVQVRLYEALQSGSIPVIIGDHVRLPFDEVIDWKKAAIVLPFSRIREFLFVLQSYREKDIAVLKRLGRFYWETYFGSTDRIIDAIIAVLQNRLQLPARNSAQVFYRPLNNRSATANLFPSEWNQTKNPDYTFRQHHTHELFNCPGNHFKFPPFSKYNVIFSTHPPPPPGHGQNLPGENFTIVMPTFKRKDLLLKNVKNYMSLPHLEKIIIVWNSPELPADNFQLPPAKIPILMVTTGKNSLNNRFLPFDLINTEAILTIDDDVPIEREQILLGFKAWKENRERMVGFPGRFHHWDAKGGKWKYSSHPNVCGLSIILTKAAFFHKNYAYIYSFVMPEAIRQKIDQYMNCEDIAMNFLVAHVTRRPPVKVSNKWYYPCPGCPNSGLSFQKGHVEERNDCINYFSQVYGYNPLLYTQFSLSYLSSKNVFQKSCVGSN